MFIIIVVVIIIIIIIIIREADPSARPRPSPSPGRNYHIRFSIHPVSITRFSIARLSPGSGLYTKYIQLYKYTNVLNTPSLRYKIPVF